MSLRTLAPSQILLRQPPLLVTTDTCCGTLTHAHTSHCTVCEKTGLMHSPIHQKNSLFLGLNFQIIWSGLLLSWLWRCLTSALENIGARWPFRSSVIALAVTSWDFLHALFFPFVSPPSCFCGAWIIAAHSMEAPEVLTLTPLTICSLAPVPWWASSQPLPDCSVTLARLDTQVQASLVYRHSPLFHKLTRQPLLVLTTYCLLFGHQPPLQPSNLRSFVMNSYMLLGPNNI